MTHFAFSCLFIAAFAAAQAQCDTLVLGTQDTVSMGPETTPFPTAFDNAKVQYLIQSSELTSLGCPVAGPIYGVILTVVDDDLAVPSPGAGFSAHVSIRHIAAASMSLTQFYSVGGLVNGTLTPYDTTGGMVNAALQAGDVLIPLSTLFDYNGVDDVLIEFCFTMDSLLGISPSVALDTTLGFNATAYGFDSVPNDGCSMTWTSPSTAIRGLNQTRPVIRFVRIPVPGTSVGETTVPGGKLYPVPATDHVVVPAAWLRPDDRRIELFDAMGRIVLSLAITDTTAPMVLPISALQVGLYTAHISDGVAAKRCIGTMVVE